MNGFSHELREDGFATYPQALEGSVDAPSPEHARQYSDSPPYQNGLLDTTTEALVCPHCQNDINSPRQEMSQSHPRTIPNSHIHLEEFKMAINTALERQFEGESYEAVRVLLLTWEANDLGLKTPERGSLILDETMNLERVFRDVYHFETTHYSIPSVNPESKVHLELSKVIDDLSDKSTVERKKVLLIVYYNGHGVVKDGMLIWSARKEWNLKSPKHPALSWYDLQKRLESAIFDVFLVLDCCQAAGAITKGSGSTMEVLAGCSREVTAVGPGMGRVIGSPFTHSLIKHLEERAMQPHGLLVAELQTFLSLDEVLEKQSPNHVVLAGHYNPIKLQPLLSKSELKKMKPLTSQPRKPELRAVLAVNFREDRLPEQEDFIQWLTSLCPRDVSGIQVQSVEIEASFDGCSTLAFVSMPLSMWAYLERSPGYWFVGFVKSRNNLMKQRNHVQKIPVYAQNRRDLEKDITKEDDQINALTARLNTERKDHVFEQQKKPRNYNRTYGTYDVERLHRLELQGHTARDYQYPSFSALAAIERLLLQFERNLPSGRTGAFLAEADVHVEGGFGSRRTGTYQGILKVVVEVVRYGTPWKDLTMAERAQRMQLIAECFHQSQKLPKLRVPKCIGFIPMKAIKAFGFLYLFPDATYVPITLLDLLKGKRRSVSMLEARIQLAKRLVSCLAELHTVGWFHKNLNSNNVIFFSKHDRSIEVDIENPYMMGLARARLDENNLDHEEIDGARLVNYCHSDYIKSRRFKAAYDYYSLGIILLEIGLWRPVQSMISRKSKASPKDIRDMLIKKHVQRLLHYTGSVYHSAVLACMDGSLISSEEGDDAASLRLNFHKRVVEVLDRISM